MSVHSKRNDIFKAMIIICPTILAKDETDYKNQMAKIAGFAKRIQIDLKDNKFALGESIPLEKIWWPEGIEADVHVMYESPQDYLETLIKLKPSMVIVHAESTCDIPKFASDLRLASIKTGLAILQDTKIEDVKYLFPHVQHLLIFSGDLGHFGGKADFSLTGKIAEAKAAHRYLEIGWDGGINAANSHELAEAGVDVLNVGGAIQNADDPQAAYATISASL
jgi:ribulose-phosphate 3-epimerase